MNKKLLLIDADGLAFHSLRESLEDSLNALDDKILNMFEETEATHYAMFISKGKYFRHNVYEDYKKPREKQRDRKTWIRTLKAVLEDKYDAQWMSEVEADDLVAYFAHKEFIYLHEPDQLWLKERCANLKMLETGTIPEVIICTPDKDLLNSIPGKHFNYSYKLENKEDPSSTVKGWWVETTYDQSSEFVRMQMIVGDTADNVPGIEGRGIKYWEKISVNSSPSYTDILTEYFEKYGVEQGIYNFQRNYRVLRLLCNDQDFIREVKVIPEDIRISKVKFETDILEDDLRDNEQNAAF